MANNRRKPKGIMVFPKSQVARQAVQLAAARNGISMGEQIQRWADADWRKAIRERKQAT